MSAQKSSVSNTISSEYLMAALSYVGVLVLIPIISQEIQKPFVAFHARQGGIILILEIFSAVAAQWVPSISSVIFLGLLLLSVIAFFYTVQGKQWKIPGIIILARLFGK